MAAAASTVVIHGSARRVADGVRAPRTYGRSMTTAAYHHSSSRETLSELLTRLKRVHAAGDSVAALASTPDTPATLLAAALESLEHDLTLALREAERAREFITR
jgi:hypothetical protein